MAGWKTGPWNSISDLAVGFFLFNISLFIWLCPVLAEARRIFVAPCGNFHCSEEALVVACGLQSTWLSSCAAPA